MCTQLVGKAPAGRDETAAKGPEAEWRVGLESCGRQGVGVEWVVETELRVVGGAGVDRPSFAVVERTFVAVRSSAAA